MLIDLYYRCNDNSSASTKKRPRVYRLDFPPHLDVTQHDRQSTVLPLHGDEEYLAGTEKQRDSVPSPFEDEDLNFERYMLNFYIHNKPISTTVSHSTTKALHRGESVSLCVHDKSDIKIPKAKNETFHWWQVKRIGRRVCRYQTENKPDSRAS